MLVAGILLAPFTGCAPDGPSLQSISHSLSPSDAAGSEQPLSSGQAPAVVLRAQTPATVTSPANDLRSSSTGASNVLGALSAEASGIERAGLQSADSKSGSVARARATGREIPLEALHQFKAHQAEINAMVVTQDGGRAYTGGSDGSVVCSSIIKADLENKQGGKGFSLEARRILQGKKPILALALSPDDKLLAVTQFSAVFVVDLATNRVLHKMTRINGRLLSVAWDPRGELLIFGRSSGEIFGWQLKGSPTAGNDSLAAIEQYGSVGGSPITHLEFHPSGRAFIAAEQEGRVTMWRLLRTERELGLRDESAAVDEDRRGSKRVDIGRTGGRLEDMWLDSEALQVYASSSDGRLYSWQLRGVVRGEPLMLGADSSLSIQGLNARSGGATVPFLFAAGRGQKLRLYCRSDAVSKTQNGGVAVEPSSPSAASDASAHEPRIVDGRLVIEPVAEQPSQAGEPKSGPEGLLAESSTFREPLSFIRSGQRAAVLWGAQKNGNLLVFDARPFLSMLSGSCTQRS